MELDGKPAIEGRNGGILTPWQPGQSGNPGGRPRSKVVSMLQDAIDDAATGAALIGEYLRLCQRAKSEELRARMLQDLLDRVGLPRMAPADGAGGVKAVATVVNIIRPDADRLGV